MKFTTVTFIGVSLIYSPLHSRADLTVGSTVRSIEARVSGNLVRFQNFTVGPFDQSITISVPAETTLAALDSDISVVGGTLTLTASGASRGADSASYMSVLFTITDSYYYSFSGSVNSASPSGDSALITLHDEDSGARIVGVSDSNELSETGILPPGEYSATFSNLRYDGRFDGQMIFTPVPEPSIFCLTAMIAACGLRRRRTTHIPAATAVFKNPLTQDG